MADNFRVIAQSFEPKIAPGGGIEESVRIRFMTPDDVEGSVLVPFEQYYPQVVAELISELADRITAVQNL